MAEGLIVVRTATPEVAVALLGDPDAFLDVLDTMSRLPMADMAAYAAGVAGCLMGQDTERDIPLFLRLVAERIEAELSAAERRTAAVTAAVPLRGAA